MDETGWRTAGERRALWGMFTDRHAYFHLAADRHADHAKSLLADTEAIVTSDRWWAYSHLPLARRQICWSHLRRDFQAHAEGLAAEKEFGEAGLKLCERLFWAWEVYQHTHDRRELKRTIRSLQRTYEPIIRSFAAKRARNRRCRGMARNLIKLWPALWTFASHEGGTADQQPRRALPAWRGDLPQALTRQPVRGRRTTYRASTLGIDHLPPSTALAVRLPQRATRSPRPRRSSPTTTLSGGGLNAYHATAPRHGSTPRRTGVRRAGGQRLWDHWSGA